MNFKTPKLKKKLLSYVPEMTRDNISNSFSEKHCSKRWGKGPARSNSGSCLHHRRGQWFGPSNTCFPFIWYIKNCEWSITIPEPFWYWLYTGYKVRAKRGKGYFLRCLHTTTSWGTTYEKAKVLSGQDSAKVLWLFLKKPKFKLTVVPATV